MEDDDNDEDPNNNNRNNEQEDEEDEGERVEANSGGCKGVEEEEGAVAAPPQLVM